MSGGRFFDAAGKRGEVSGFKEELNHSSKEKKKEALKKVIQAMTVGSDVSSLFPDVVNCMQTQSLDLKKLVYLYVINYAKSQPDLAILAIHSFRKDANDQHNPLLRALAVRTMGCIRLNQMTEYLLEPLRRTCRDPDPYVRKTATICIAKLFDIHPELVEDQGFIEVLRDMLTDANSMVVANAVASLCEISHNARRDYLLLNEDVVFKLLPALDNCSEWHQVFILDALAMFEPPSSRVAESILERSVVARLCHANSAVVLSAVKVMMKFMDKIQSPEVVRAHCKKMTPPLVTLLSAEPEIQYVVMRNINLIVQKQPRILDQDVRMFVCKYNDPLYVKLEKIAVMVQLASEQNINQILSEFREYASEVDIEVVRKSVRAIGHCAIKLSRAAERCVDCLLELVQTKVSYVVQEAVVVIRDIFRKYPGKYEVIISDLSEHLENLDEPEAKAAMIWIVGEYADGIEVSAQILQDFLQSFPEEPPMVQLQLLTAIVKGYLKYMSPGNNDSEARQTFTQLVSQVLQLCTKESSNPDLRDRGFMYWRLLGSNPEQAKQVVLSERPTISDESFATNPRILDRLVGLISTLSSVYHELPEQFIMQREVHETQAGSDEDEESDGEAKHEAVELARKEMQTRGHAYEENSGGESDDDEEIGSDVASSDDEGRKSQGGAASSSAQASNGSNGNGPPPPPLRPNPTVLTEQTPGQGKKTGCKVAAGLIRGPGGKLGLQMMVGNFSSQPMLASDWAIKINKNPFGLSPTSPLQLPDVGPNGGTAQTTLLITPNKDLSNTPPGNPLYLEVALKTSIDVFYFSVAFDLYCVLGDQGPAPTEMVQKTWASTPAERKATVLGQFSSPVTPEMTIQRCRQYFLYTNAQTQGQDGSLMIYLSGLTCNKLVMICELRLQNGGPGIQLTCCCPDAPPLVPIVQAFMSELLRVKWQPPG